MTFDLHSLTYISEDFKETNVLERIIKSLSIYGCLISCCSSRGKVKTFFKKRKAADHDPHRSCHIIYPLMQ